MISFENVCFSYEKNKPVIRDLSFRIEDGESVGLIGANGAGKSTVMKLLLGLLPAQGRILVDDLQVTKDNLGPIRRKLGFVLQNSDNQMFMPTVYEDMIFGPLNYSLSREETERRFGIPKKNEKIREEDLEQLAKDALADACYPGNPREATLEQVIDMFRQLM